MTVEELIETLKQYPADALVEVDAEGIPPLSEDSIRLVEYPHVSILWLATSHKQV